MTTKASRPKAKKKSSNTSVEAAAKRALEAGEPFEAWQLAMAGAKKIGDAPPERLPIIIEALASICRDLDEHGDANLELYGGRKYSDDQLYEFLKQAKDAAKALRNAKAGPAPTLKAAGPSRLKLGKPVVLCDGDGPPPLVTVAGFLCRMPGSNNHGLRSLKDGALVRELQPIGVMGYPKSFAVSPDGRFVALGSHTRCSVFAAATGKKVATWEDFPGDVCAVAFSPDGALLAMGEPDRISIAPVKGGAPRVTRRFEKELYFDAFGWTPTGKKLVATYDDTLVVFDSRRLETLLEEELSIQQCVLHVLDERRAFIRPICEVGIVDLETGRILSRLDVAKEGGGFVRASVNASRTLAALQTDDKDASSLEIYRLAPLTLLARIALPDVVSSMVAQCGTEFALDDSGLIVVGEAKTMWVGMIPG